MLACVTLLIYHRKYILHTPVLSSEDLIEKGPDHVHIPLYMFICLFLLVILVSYLQETSYHLKPKEIAHACIS